MIEGREEKIKRALRIFFFVMLKFPAAHWLGQEFQAGKAYLPDEVETHSKRRGTEMAFSPFLQDPSFLLGLLYRSHEL